MRARHAWILATALLLAVPEGVQAVELVVHADNPVQSLSAGEARRIFLGEQSFWRGTARPSEPIRPALRGGAEGQVLVHLGIRTNEFVSRWMRLVFSGQAVSPHQAESDRAVLEYVAANLSAIGLVEEFTPTPGVKAIPITD
ncbi:MAG: hypothetical protein OEW11_09940 [Nitrospirota bacterium]|nr:hypothetical protein [Nitrospirota bacterium]